ncbi:MAG: caspase family protein [Deltaproteobacteria bacterium]
MKRALQLGVLAALASFAAEADAGTRIALVVGANRGAPGDELLRYAETDAARITDILTSIGGFEREDVVSLVAPTAARFTAALDDIDRRAAAHGDGALVFVYYSGHADAEALHLGDTRLPLTELRDRVVSSPAGARVLVLDACRSGVLTRVKGGVHGAAFPVNVVRTLEARGVAIIASSAAGEDAQESDELGASFFTHFFASAMRGAGDHDEDGIVTLQESFAYASHRTLAATNVTIAGPQHPTYKIDLEGRDDLALTDVRAARAGIGVLEFVERGRYLVQERDRDVTVAEVALERGRRAIAVAAGPYRVTRRGDDHLMQGDFDVPARASRTVSSDDMSRLAFARVVRKGGTDVTSATSAFVTGGVRGSILGGGSAWLATFGGRYDTALLSFELRMSAGAADTSNARVSIGSSELGIGGAVLRALDAGPLTFSAGLELAGICLLQRFDDATTPRRTSFGLAAGPLVMAELPVGRLFFRLETAVPAYVLRAGASPDDASATATFTFRAGLGVGTVF